MAQSPYYYGVQRKALTGMGYGPYYGKRYMGGRGQVDTQVSPQGVATELSEKYATEPTAEYATEPAISTPAPTPAIKPPWEGGSGMYGSQEETTGKQTGLPGTRAGVSPREAINTVAWGVGLRSTPPRGFPQPTGVYKTAGQIGKVAASALTGIPFTGIIYNYAKLFLDTLISPVFPGLYSTESLTTAAEAARGAKQSMEYSSWGMFGTPVTGPQIGPQTTSAQEEADAAAANAAEAAAEAAAAASGGFGPGGGTSEASSGGDIGVGGGGGGGFGTW